MTNDFYQKIKIPYTLTFDAFTEAREHCNRDRAHNHYGVQTPPDLIQCVESLDVNLTLAEDTTIFFTQPNKFGETIHSDTEIDQGCANLNWVFNKGDMIWYLPKNSEYRGWEVKFEIENQYEGERYSVPKLYAEEEMQEVFRAELSELGSVVVNCATPHRVHASDQERWCFATTILDYSTRSYISYQEVIRRLQSRPELLG